MPYTKARCFRVPGLDKCFLSFYFAPNERGAVGLGLAILRHKAHPCLKVMWRDAERIEGPALSLVLSPHSRLPLVLDICF